MAIEATDGKTDEAALVMQKYGVKRVPVDYFHIGAYRYTDLKDAVAQAKRMKTKAPV